MVTEVLDFEVLVTNNLKWRYRLIYGKIDSYNSTNIKKGDIAVYRLQQFFSDVKKIVQEALDEKRGRPKKRKPGGQISDMVYH